MNGKNDIDTSIVKKMVDRIKGIVDSNQKYVLENEKLTKENAELKSNQQNCASTPTTSPTQPAATTPESGTKTYKINLIKADGGSMEAIFDAIDKEDNIDKLMRIITHQGGSRRAPSDMLNVSQQFLICTKTYPIGDPSKNVLHPMKFTPFQYACYAGQYRCAAYLLSCILMGGKEVYIKHRYLKVQYDTELSYPDNKFITKHDGSPLAKSNAFQLISTPYDARNVGFFPDFVWKEFRSVIAYAKKKRQKQLEALMSAVDSKYNLKNEIVVEIAKTDKDLEELKIVYFAPSRGGYTGGYEHKTTRKNRQNNLDKTELK